MKKFFQFILYIAIGIICVLVYANMKARWDLEERRAEIDRVLQEKIARANADIARKNQIAERLYQEALQNEASAQSRWEAAKARGSLPANDNTREGFTTVTTNVPTGPGTRR